MDILRSPKTQRRHGNMPNSTETCKTKLVKGCAADVLKCRRAVRPSKTDTQREWSIFYTHTAKALVPLKPHTKTDVL